MQEGLAQALRTTKGQISQACDKTDQLIALVKGEGGVPVPVDENACLKEKELLSKEVTRLTQLLTDRANTCMNDVKGVAERLQSLTRQQAELQQAMSHVTTDFRELVETTIPNKLELLTKAVNELVSSFPPGLNENAKNLQAAIEHLQQYITNETRPVLFDDAGLAEAIDLLTTAANTAIATRASSTTASQQQLLQVISDAKNDVVNSFDQCTADFAARKTALAATEAQQKESINAVLVAHKEQADVLFDSIAQLEAEGLNNASKIARLNDDLRARDTEVRRLKTIVDYTEEVIETSQVKESGNVNDATSIQRVIPKPAVIKVMDKYISDAGAVTYHVHVANAPRGQLKMPHLTMEDIDGMQYDVASLREGMIKMQARKLRRGLRTRTARE